MEFFSKFLGPQSDLHSPVSDDAGSSRLNGFSDEYVTMTLASSCPKKRAGRKKFRETRHPVYRGVRRRDSGKWVCEVRKPNSKSRIWLGTFPTEEMAARAHDVAAIALRGRSACLNFADSAWRLPVPASSTTEDIQDAAAKAAEIFRPSEKSAAPPAEEEDEEKPFYLDEEVVFGMPGLLTSMAEGMLLPPPPQCRWTDDDDMEVIADVGLWSYSI